MADSKRELILSQFETVLASTTGISGRVYRSRATAVDKTLAPCIFLDWDADQAQPQATVFDECTLNVIVRVHTRGSAPDTLADAVMLAAHALIMADTTLGGNALDVTMSDTSFQFDDADATAGMLTQVYQVMYRHSVADLAA